MSTILWILPGVLLGVLYLTTLILFGLTTLAKGHTALFFVGLVFPFLWIVGAIMGPKRMSAAQARTRLRTASCVSMARPKPGRELAELDALLESSQPTRRGDLASNA